MIVIIPPTSLNKDELYEWYTEQISFLNNLYRPIEKHGFFTIHKQRKVTRSRFEIICQYMYDKHGQEDDCGFFVCPGGFTFNYKGFNKFPYGYVCLGDLPGNWITWCMEEHKICVETLLNNRSLWLFTDYPGSHSLDSVMLPLWRETSIKPVKSSSKYKKSYVIAERIRANTVELATEFETFTTKRFIFPFDAEKYEIFNYLEES